MENMEWIFWDKFSIEAYVHHREGEIRLGSQVLYGDFDELKKSKATYALYLVPEDVGIRANLGVGGAQSNYQAFLNAFLNIQSHESLRGTEIFMAGMLSPKWSESLKSIENIEELRAHTQVLDHWLSEQLKPAFQAGKIPILIGGGHNNAYPLIQAAFKHYQQGINVINIDAHADSRRLEGRHSGNSFSYAREEGMLNNYGLLGWQEAYNHPKIITNLRRNKDNVLISFEDLFLRKKVKESEALKIFKPLQMSKYGLELDVDTIEGALSSAWTPLGISPQQAYHWVYQLSQSQELVYFHLPEGVALRKDGMEDKTMGKLLSFLVQAFIKGHQEQ